MSLAHDIEILRQQRAAELHTLHLTYLHSKRTLLRTTSPPRLIRQNVAASLGIATAIGLLLAPTTGSPAPIPSSDSPSPPPEKPAHPPHNHSLLRTLLKEAALLLLSKIDLKKIIALALESITHSTNPSPPDQHPENPHPNVSVSNAGTVRASNLDDFQ